MANASVNVSRPGARRNTGQAATMAAIGWHPEEIKAAIRMRGETMASLARRHGYHSGAVRLAVRYRGSRAVEKLIAELLRVPPQVIWPDRYYSDGTPVDRRLVRDQRRTSGQHQRRAA